MREVHHVTKNGAPQSSNGKPPLMRVYVNIHETWATRSDDCNLTLVFTRRGLIPLHRLVSLRTLSALICLPLPAVASSTKTGAMAPM